MTHKKIKNKNYICDIEETESLYHTGRFICGRTDRTKIVGYVGGKEWINVYLFPVSNIEYTEIISQQFKIARELLLCLYPK